MMNRRALLAALPASGLALATPADASANDPILPLYHEWIAAMREWVRLMDMPGNEDFDWPESIAANNRADHAMFAMIELTPTSVEGLAALSHVMWYLSGPCFRPDQPEYEEQCEEPAKKAMLAIWRAASGEADHPPRFC